MSIGVRERDLFVCLGALGLISVPRLNSLKRLTRGTCESGGFLHADIHTACSPRIVLLRAMLAHVPHGSCSKRYECAVKKSLRRRLVCCQERDNCWNGQQDTSRSP